jgi:hypothetical protein
VRGRRGYDIDLIVSWVLVGLLVLIIVLLFTR